MNTLAHYRHHIAVITIIAALAIASPIGWDWRIYNISNISQLQAPYNTPKFVGMPFALFMLPHALLNINIGGSINTFMNVAVMVLVARKYAGEQWYIALAIALTTPFTAVLLAANNIEWIPLLAFLVPDSLAYPLLAMKPQMLAGSALIRFKNNPHIARLLPLVAVLIASVLLWGAWWVHLGGGLVDVPWNFAPWPFGIPLGIYLLWIAWKRDDQIIAAAATPFLVPYFAIYSVTGLHLLLACRYRKASMWLWLVGWWFMVIAARWAL